MGTNEVPTGSKEEINYVHCTFWKYGRDETGTYWKYGNDKKILSKRSTYYNYEKIQIKHLH